LKQDLRALTATPTLQYFAKEYQDFYSPHRTIFTQLSQSIFDFEENFTNFLKIKKEVRTFAVP
jgi:hypothetical protein